MEYPFPHDESSIDPNENHSLDTSTSFNNTTINLLDPYGVHYATINGTISFESLHMSDLNVSNPSQVNYTTDPDESFHQSTGSFSGFNITLTTDQFNSINDSINTTRESSSFGDPSFGGPSFGDPSFGGKRRRKKRTLKKKRSRKNKKRSRSRR